MSTRPTDGTPRWADGSDAAISTPTSGKMSQGWLAQEKPPHQYFNWFQNLVYRWVNFFDLALFHEAGDNGQHDEDGDHWEVRVKGAVDANKLVVFGAGGGESTATYLIELRATDGGALVGYIDVSGTMQIQALDVVGGVVAGTVSQDDTTNRTEVVPGLAGFLVSSGTRIETGAGLGYDENDATTRTIRYWAPKMPEHAILRSVKVITTPGDAANVVNAELWETDNATNSTKTSHGSITSQTGVTGNQSATVTISGTLTQAGAKGWWVDVAVQNNAANGVYVNKIVWDYDITRF